MKARYAVPFATGAKAPEGDFSAERLLDLMAANGVARTVLIQVIHYKWDNRYLADVLRGYPGEVRLGSRSHLELLQAVQAVLTA